MDTQNTPTIRSRIKDLTSILGVGTQATYLNMRPDREGAVRSFATKFAHFLGVSDFGSIERALMFAAFGCTLNIRKEARERISTYPCKTIEQLAQLQMLQMQHAYHSRYNQGRSAHEIAMLNWAYDAGVARILGTKIPRKPHEPGAKKVT